MPPQYFYAGRVPITVAVRHGVGQTARKVPHAGNEETAESLEGWQPKLPAGLGGTHAMVVTVIRFFSAKNIKQYLILLGFGAVLNGKKSCP